MYILMYIYAYVYVYTHPESAQRYFVLFCRSHSYLWTSPPTSSLSYLKRSFSSELWGVPRAAKVSSTLVWSAVAALSGWWSLCTISIWFNVLRQIFTRVSQIKYQMLFRLVLQLKYTEKRLNEVWQVSVRYSRCEDRWKCTPECLVYRYRWECALVEEIWKLSRQFISQKPYD